nr:beta 3 protein, ClpB=peptide 19 [Escherichia coli, Peptide Partial, 10 aa] [Escherichia coli]
ERQYDELEEE